jgi:hypothetical protein
MNFSCITRTTFEIEFDSRQMIFKESLSPSCVLGDDDDDSTESTFYEEDCTSLVLDDDYFDDESSASTCSNNSSSSSSSSLSSSSSSGSSSSCSSESSVPMAPSRRAVTSRFGDEDSIVLARARSQPPASPDQERDQEEMTVSLLLEGLTIEFELPLKPLEGENGLFYPAAAAA